MYQAKIKYRDGTQLITRHETFGDALAAISSPAPNPVEVQYVKISILHR